MKKAALPQRLEPDAIVEALIELRFETSSIPETIIGQLVGILPWQPAKHVRLPVAEIPPPIREADPNLRFQPLLELSRGDGLRVAKLGERVISYHIVNKYPGWAAFRTEWMEVVRGLVRVLPGLTVPRAGFRYINALRPDVHFVQGIQDTNIDINIGEISLKSSLVLQFASHFNDHTVTTRVATPELVLAPIAGNFSLLVDIDVTSSRNELFSDIDSLVAWIDVAHDLEKTEFFRILPKNIVEKLEAEEKSGNV